MDIHYRDIRKIDPTRGENGNAKVNHGSGEIVLLRAE